MQRTGSHSGEMVGLGAPTLHTRVESWECDYNDHWNTRFYGRAFQLASETATAHGGQANHGVGRRAVRHMRFHRELRVASNVEVRSGVLRDAAGLDGAVVHILAGDGRLAATAIDIPGGETTLPDVAAADVPLALPRGLGPEPPGAWPETPAEHSIVELGPVRPCQFDHAGTMLFEELIRCGSIASSHQLFRLGLTPGFSERTRINRMAVEMRATLEGEVASGTRLRVQSRLADVSGRTLRTEHRVLASDGGVIARFEFCLVTVNIDTRRAVPVPDEILGAWQELAAQDTSNRRQ